MNETLTSHGMILIDKPEGISSASVVYRLKKMSGAGKVGHAGTLDPFATGLLVCGINSGTRISRFFLHGNKTYEGTLHLGVTTDTLDSTGQVLTTRVLDQDIEKNLHSVFRGFLGKQMQSPPVYSALKHEGTPLYKLARKGKPVQKPARAIEIFHLEITAINIPDVLFTVSCSGGTYIRSLCHDLGEVLGCGGHLSQLRRTETCGFRIGDAVTLEKAGLLSEEGRIETIMVPMSDALKDMPAFKADRALQKKISFGQRPGKSDQVPVLSENHNYNLKMIDENNELLAILEYNCDKKKYDYCCVFHKK